MSVWTHTVNAIYVTGCDRRCRSGAQVLQNFCHKYSYLLPKGSESGLQIFVHSSDRCTGFSSVDSSHNIKYYGDACILIYGGLRDLHKEEFVKGLKKFLKLLRKQYSVDYATILVEDYFGEPYVARVVDNVYKNLSRESFKGEDL